MRVAARGGCPAGHGGFPALLAARPEARATAAANRRKTAFSRGRGTVTAGATDRPFAGERPRLPRAFAAGNGPEPFGKAVPRRRARAWPVCSAAGAQVFTFPTAGRRFAVLPVPVGPPPPSAVFPSAWRAPLRIPPRLLRGAAVPNRPNTRGCRRVPSARRLTGNPHGRAGRGNASRWGIGKRACAPARKPVRRCSGRAAVRGRSPAEGSGRDGKAPAGCGRSGRLHARAAGAGCPLPDGPAALTPGRRYRPESRPRRRRAKRRWC